MTSWVRRGTTFSSVNLSLNLKLQSTESHSRDSAYEFAYLILTQHSICTSSSVWNNKNWIVALVFLIVTKLCCFVKAWRQLLATLGPVPLWAFLWQAGPWPLHRLVILPVLVSFCSLVHIIEHDDSLPPKCDVFYNLWRWVWVGRHLSSNDCETGAVSLSTYVAVHAMPVPTLGHGSC